LSGGALSGGSLVDGSVVGGAAAGRAALRAGVLRLVLRCCPAPWTDGERAVLVRHRAVLAAGAGELAHADRDALLDLLASLAPHLTPVAALDVAVRLRAAPPAPAGARTTLTVLRACGAVLTRADLERALADAALGADPWRGEVRVLRTAFGAPSSTVESRELLAALIETWPSTGALDRPALLDRMTALQPLDAPQWTIGEEAARSGPAPRVPHDGDLDQPRSAALRDRLLAMLDDPRPGTTQRRRAAEALRTWPEPDIQRRLLQVYLHRDAGLPSTRELAHALVPADLATTRAVELTFHLPPAELAPLIPALLRIREDGDPELRQAADRALRRLPRETVEGLLADRVEPVLMPAPADLGLPDGLLERPTPPVPVRPASRQDLLRLARDGDAGQIRFALAGLAGPAGGDADLAALLEDLLRHPDPKVRLHAHRVSRQALDRPTYLRHSELLLADPRPDIVRSAIRAVGGARWTPAIGAVVGLLLHPEPSVRRAAAAALTRFGPAAAPALTKAAARARPDRRAVYTAVLATLDT
jgi:hypothetical protein